MGDRYILELTCKICGFKDKEVYFAPTCGFTEWTCPNCFSTVDLCELTGITYEDASNAAEIQKICEGIVEEAKMT